MLGHLSWATTSPSSQATYFTRRTTSPLKSRCKYCLDAQPFPSIDLTGQQYCERLPQFLLWAQVWLQTETRPVCSWVWHDGKTRGLLRLLRGYVASRERKRFQMLNIPHGFEAAGTQNWGCPHEVTQLLVLCEKSTQFMVQCVTDCKSETPLVNWNCRRTSEGAATHIFNARRWLFSPSWLFLTSWLNLCRREVQTWMHGVVEGSQLLLKPQPTISQTEGVSCISLENTQEVCRFVSLFGPHSWYQYPTRLTDRRDWTIAGSRQWPRVTQPGGTYSHIRMLKAIMARSPCRKIPNDSIRAPFSHPRVSGPGFGDADVLATDAGPAGAPSPSWGRMLGPPTAAMGQKSWITRVTDSCVLLDAPQRLTVS